jgi:hypothetical protein
MCGCVDYVNALIVQAHQGEGEPSLVEPDQGTVAFASGLHNWCATYPPNGVQHEQEVLV